MSLSLGELKERGEAPEFLTPEAFQMLHGGYLQKDETPKDAYRRVAKTISSELGKPELENIFFDLIWKNWLCPASPCLSNLGTRNLPISCFSAKSMDDLFDIMKHVQELVMLSKYGGGVGSSFSDLRQRGAPVSRGGTSGGIVPFLKMVEAAVDGTTQGSSRRGSVASYLDFSHGDVDEFIDVRRPTGDISRRCLTKSFHNAISITDEEMNEIKSTNGKYRERWNRIMLARFETGEPYLMFKGNANKNCPDGYVGRIHQSNLCSEIMAPVTSTETFVCCLSSLNLAKYNEWKKWKDTETGKTLVELSIMFLDGVLTAFIKQAKCLAGMENAVRFAENHRMLGLGALGWHSLLQQEGIAFDSFEAMKLNAEIFSKMRKEADKATLDLGKEYGECKETFGTGRRNTATLAIAPTMSNSVLSGGVSQGIEPITANLFVQKGAKGSFLKKNAALTSLLISLGKDTPEVWDQINRDKGSVKNLNFLSEEQKLVFATARELNQHSLVKQAAQRQKWIDQGQSLNLFFSLPQTKEDAVKVSRYVNEVHIAAWESGVKSLYYMKTESPIKGEAVFRTTDECEACSG